jgi:hypothetical protein
MRSVFDRLLYRTSAEIANEEMGAKFESLGQGGQKLLNK